MLVIRNAQMEAFWTAAQSQRRERLFFRLSTRRLLFPVVLLGLQLDIGLNEGARFGISRESELAEFLETVFTRIGEFQLDSEGRAIYPPGADRFLLADTVPVAERLRRFAEWVTPSGEGREAKAHAG